MKKIIFLLMALCLLSIKVWAADPAGNDDWRNATYGSDNIVGTLGYDEGDGKIDTQDWYCFDITDDCHLKFTISSTELELSGMSFGGLKNDYVTNRAAWGGGWDEHYGGVMIVNDVAPGKYYLNVRRFDGKGSYTINVERTYCNFSQPDEEPNDDFEHALTLPLNKWVDGHIGFKYINDQEGDADIDDWYKFTVPNDGHAVFKIHLEQQLGTYFRLYYVDDANNIIQRLEKSIITAHQSDTTLVLDVPDLKAGNYACYIRRGSARGGCYKFICEYEPCKYGGLNGNDVEPNNDAQTAQVIELNQQIFGHLGYWDYNKNSRQDNADYYKVIIPADGYATIDFTTDNVPLYYVAFDALSANYNTSVAHDIISLYEPTHEMHLKCMQLAAGEYIIIVRASMGLNDFNNAGGYSFRINYSPSPYYSGVFGTEDKPVVINEGESITSTLGFYHDNKSAERFYSHYYEFNPTKPNSCINIDVDHCNDLAVLAQFYKVHEDGTKELVNLSVGNGGHENISTERLQIELPEAGKWLMNLQRTVVNGKNNCSGGYLVAFGERKVKAAKGDVIIHANGPKFVQKGVYRYYEVAVENNTYDITDPFVFAWDKTDDVIIGDVKYKDKSGNWVTRPYSDISHKDGSFSVIFPYLSPKETVTFGFYAKGKGDLNSKIRTIFLGELPDTWMAAVAVGKTENVTSESGETEDNGGVSEFLWKKVEQLTQVGNDEEMHEIWKNCYDEYMEPLIKNKYDGNDCGFVPTLDVVGTVLDNTLKQKPVEWIGTEEKSTITNGLGSGKELVWNWAIHDEYFFNDPYIGSQYPVKVQHPSEGFIDGVWVFTSMVSSVDPNEITGPLGVGENNYIGETKQMEYTIRFENEADATAPAYRVRISNELDPNIFDVNSVKFGTTSHEGAKYNWKMKREGNLLTWDIEGIDLVPNVNAPEGEGYVTYTVNLLPELADGTVISNKASIIFDENTPIETNTYINTLDLTAPTTTMLAAEMKNDSTLTVTCSSIDIASGVAMYELYGSFDEGDYIYLGKYYSDAMECQINASKWAECTSARFYAIAIDAVGNKETSAPTPTEIVVTGIEELHKGSNVVDRDCYNVLGQKVSSNTRGIVIKNGKKYFQK